MSEYYVGEIRWFPYNFTPVGWADCDGRLLAINEYSFLFNLIGTIYGGDGQTTFGLPDLRGRVAVHQGAVSGLSNRTLGEAGGTETVALISTQMPVHTHKAIASAAAADRISPSGAVPGTLASGEAMYVTTPSSGTTVAMSPSLGAAGASQPHNNLAPTLTIRACIALNGTFPPQA